MVLHGTSVGWLLTVASGAVAAAICAWLWHRAGLQLALLVLLHRLFGLVLFAARLMLSFVALSLSVPLLDTLPFAFASIAGSASSIAPAGLGVGEAMAGMIAHSVAVAPAAAFLAVAINRIGGLAATAVVASILELASPRFPKSDSLT
jgi:hypothetical protein